ncbi:MAG TPA: prephenate dehydrogenase/arogenate dehydrogenase family protein [Vicinamibacterales bacterium]|nr:prephenate dehydrogenase/arogenate dehydrogenase family protein [Vicinamibacterales bacterium]
MPELPVIQPGRPAEPPPFAKIAIVGVGLIGGSIALAARARWPAALVIGIDRNDVLERAMLRHAIDVGADDLGMAAEADLVILAAPVRTNVALVGRLAGMLAGEAVVTDTGSTKRAVVAAARALPPRLVFVGGHPLAGAARSGIEHARADLFEGRPWLFTPDATTDPAAVERLLAFARGLGARPRTIGPAEHDQLAAFLSHLPQLAASALMHVVGEAIGEDGLGLAGRGLADTTRLASSPAAIWKDICATNADEIGRALDALIAVLTALRADLEMGDRLEAIFESAARWRARLPASGA